MQSTSQIIYKKLLNKETDHTTFLNRLTIQLLLLKNKQNFLN